MHNVESKWLRRTLCIAGFAASIILLACSGAMNYQYGYTLGTTDLNRSIYGGAAASADVLMALSPFFFFAAWKNSEYTRAAAAAILWTITTAFAAQSAIGHAAVNRLDVMSQRTVVATSYGDIRADIAQARKDLGFVPEHRAEATVRAEIEKHKVQQWWYRTGECTEIAGKTAREYCSQYHGLNAELGHAMEATKLKARIEALTARSEKASTENAGKVASEADPQAKFVAMWFGADLRAAQGWLTLLVVVVILSGAGLGPYVSLALMQAPAAMPQEKDQPPTPLQPVPEQRALPPPPSPRTARDPSAIITVRPEPNPKWRALLDRIDFPPAGAYLWGEPRDAESAERSALRFVVWMGANKESGYFTPDQLNELYQEFCAADHRAPRWMSLSTPTTVKKAIVKAIGDSKVLDSHSGPAGPIWAIVPPSTDKMTALLEKGGVLPASEPNKEAAPEPPTPVRQVIAEKPDTQPLPGNTNVVALPPRKSGTAT